MRKTMRRFGLDSLRLHYSSKLYYIKFFCFINDQMSASWRRHVERWTWYIYIHYVSIKIIHIEQQNTDWWINLERMEISVVQWSRPSRIKCVPLAGSCDSPRTRFEMMQCMQQPCVMCVCVIHPAVTSGVQFMKLPGIKCNKIIFKCVILCCWLPFLTIRLMNWEVKFMISPFRVKILYDYKVTNGKEVRHGIMWNNLWFYSTQCVCCDSDLIGFG